MKLGVYKFSEDMCLIFGELVFLSTLKRIGSIFVPRLGYLICLSYFEAVTFRLPIATLNNIDF